jgi:hypothetical protein
VDYDFLKPKSGALLFYSAKQKRMNAITWGDYVRGKAGVFCGLNRGTGLYL